MTERRSLRKIWAECYFWSFPYYLVGAGVVGMIAWLHGFTDWQTSLLTLPVVYLIYRSYRLYLGKLEDEKRHVEEMADLHMRTIEALALAIEAKDQTTHDHCRESGFMPSRWPRSWSLTEEMEALQAAALLHDIGKLAIPEHIISKPGRLTPEEFEKMKIHPMVGADILERVQFPYPVVPIVRAHHEKWDGTGYPSGLERGADSDWRAHPGGGRLPGRAGFRSAISACPAPGRSHGAWSAESGKAFDPRVVRVLERKYVELEATGPRTHSMSCTSRNYPTEVRIRDRPRRAIQPAAGFEAQGRRHLPEAQFSELDRGGASGSADSVRTQPGLGSIAQSG